jgi:endonuclease/exonuclease/phosphatase family metal-dependent hydrolase
LILVTLLAYLAPHLNPAKIWQLTYLGLAYPIFLFANIGFAIFWALRRDRYAWFSVGCILAGLGYFGGFFNLSFAETAKDPDAAISVLTYNIASLDNYAGKKGKRQEALEADFKEFASQIEQPDVFCMQEWKGEKLTGLVNSTFGFANNYRVENTAIFSKFPIQNKGSLDFGNTTNNCVWADLKTPKGTVRFYSVHLQSNKLTQTADKIATKGHLNDEQTWRDIRFVMGRYKTAVAIRAKQAQQVAEHIAKSPYPVILCGDFNDPPVSYTYNLLSKSLQDSFCEKGSGVGSTFAGNLPFLRIDYVLPGKKFKVLNHTVIGTKLSDHYPVEVLLEWAK